MSIAIVCLHCGKSLKAPDRLAGKRARCSRCASPISIPQQEEQSVAAANLPQHETEDFAGVAISAAAPSPSSCRRPQSRGRQGRWITWLLIITGGLVPFGVSAFVIRHMLDREAVKQYLTPASAKPAENRTPVAVVGVDEVKRAGPPAPPKPDSKPDSGGRKSDVRGQKSEARAPKVDWKSVTAEVETPELSISLKHAIACTFLCNSFNTVVKTESLCIRVRVENKTKTKLIRWRGWQGRGTAEDEFGNKYKPNCPSKFDWNAVTNPSEWRNGFKVPDKFGLREDKDRLAACNWTGDCGGSIGPEKVYLGILYLEVPIEQATEIRLTLPASSYDPDSTAMHRFRMPIARELAY